MGLYGSNTLRINSTNIKKPTTFKIERYNVTNLERNAAGLMCGDLIAKKRKFYFTYDAISARDLDTILNVLWETDDIFYTLTYDENNVQKSVTVYAGSIPSDLHHAGPSEEWVWKNVTFNLIER